MPDPRAPARGLPPVGGDAQPAARLRHRRLRQPRATSHHWMLGFVEGPPAVATLSRSWPTASPRRSTSCAPCGIDPENASGDAHHRFLHQPRGAAARLRAGDDPRRFDHRRLVRHLRPHDLDRRPHAPARPRPCRVSAAASRTRSASNAARRSTPDELLQLIDIAQPGERARPPDADLPLRRRQGRPSICRALVRAVKREGRTVVWSCDPMHGNTIKAANGYKTRPFERDPAARSAASSPSTRRRAPMPAASISR